MHGHGGVVVAGVRDEDPADIAAAVHVDEVGSHLGLAEWLRPPLHLDEVVLAVDPDGTVYLLDDPFSGVAGDGEGFPERDVVHYEQAVEDAFKGFAPAADIAFTEKPVEVSLHPFPLSPLRRIPLYLSPTVFPVLGLCPLMLLL